MHGLTTTEAWFYALVWSFAFCPAVARSLWDSDIGGVRRGAALGTTAGCLSVAIISLHLGSGGFSGSDGSAWTFLGCSILIGFMGKEQEKIARWAFARVAKLIGLPMDETNKTDQQNKPN